MMQIKRFIFNPVQVNTYLVYDDSGECAIIDAGCFGNAEERALSGFIAEQNLKPVHLLNTHGHFDHVFGTHYVKQHYGIAPEGHPADNQWLAQMAQRAAAFGFRDVPPAEPLGKELGEGDTVRFGNTTLRVLHVPGHSAGSLCFYSELDGTLFAGDVLFRQSIGRTDLPQGDYGTLIRNIQEKLLVLPAETIVYCGHGEATTIGFEQQNNPFL